MRIAEEDFDSFIRNNSSNAIDIMRNLANTIVTMNFNINLILEELSEATKMEPEKFNEIAKRVRQYAPIEPGSQSQFTLYG